MVWARLLIRSFESHFDGPAAQLLTFLAYPQVELVKLLAWTGCSSHPRASHAWAQQHIFAELNIIIIITTSLVISGKRKPRLWIEKTACGDLNCYWNEFYFSRSPQNKFLKFFFIILCWITDHEHGQRLMEIHVLDVMCEVKNNKQNNKSLFLDKNYDLGCDYQTRYLIWMKMPLFLFIYLNFT